MGKLDIPEELLNKRAKLTEQEWEIIKQHPEAGFKRLEQCERVHSLVLTVVREHHERMDGSGYPDALRGDEIDIFSRICAVVDSFDAMTTFRPFKFRNLSVSEALMVLKRETPEKYDPKVVGAWLHLLESAVGFEPCGEANVSRPATANQDHRREQRFHLYRLACVHVLDDGPDGWSEQPAVQVTAHSLSRSGLGVLSPVPIRIGEKVHVYILARDWNRDYLVAEVVRCRTHSDGWHDVGMQLTSKSSSTEPRSVRPAPGRT